MRPITERLSPLIKYLVISNGFIYAFYVVVKAARPLFEDRLMLGPRVLAGDFWQPLTSLFVHQDVISFLFNIFGLWWAGAEIERQVGTRRFVMMYLGIGVLANLVLVAWMLAFRVPVAAAGPGASVIAVYMAYGTIFDRTPARFFGALVLEARAITAIIMGFVILSDLAMRAWPHLVSHLVAMLAGYVLVGGRGEGLKRMWHSAHAKRVRRRYQVLEGGRRGTRPEDLN